MLKKYFLSLSSIGLVAILLPFSVTYGATNMDTRILLDQQYKDRQEYDTCLKKAQKNAQNDLAKAEKQCRHHYALKRLFTPKQLLSFYKEYILEAEDIYTDRLIAIKGKVSSAGIGDLGLPEIIFATDAFGLEGVRCRFPKSAAESIAKIEKDTEIYVGGICTGLRYDRYIRLINCELLTK